MKKFLVVALIAGSTVLVAQSKRPITFDDLIGMGRVADLQLSPDGKNLAFVVTRMNKEENKSNSNIFVVPVAGGPVRQITNAKGANNTPRWMPDSKTIAFVSSRDDQSQVWTVTADSLKEKKISNVATEVSGLAVSPDGKWFAFASDVYPDAQDEEANVKRAEAVAKSKVKAKIFDHLPYRVWNYWKDGKRSHLFIMPSTGGRGVDMTRGDFDAPPIDLGGNWNFTFSPDSKEFTFERNTDPNIAISTNNDIWTVPVTGGEPKRITENPANDNQPLYSPDGKQLAYRAMKRAGFEADQYDLMLLDRATGKVTNLTEAFDLSVNEVAFGPKSIYFTAEEKGNISVFKWNQKDNKIVPILNKGFNTDIKVLADGFTVVFLQQTVNRPVEVFKMDNNGKGLKQLSSVNTDKLAPLEMNPLTEFWFEGAEKAKVHGFLLKPAGFDSTKKYPMIYLVHGGPQGAWGDDFHYRWNAQMFASRGHVVVMVNPRGSTGYGQKFTDEISGDWGGKVYEDLMNGVDFVLKTYPFIDGNRMAAAGASYGGYMMNWFLGHTDRFKAIVSHDGVFNPFSAYGTTEELWFNEWEFGGTPYKNPELFKKWSPMEYAANFKTPTLVIHGQLDYRLDVSEGFQLFTALQRQGVESKMLYFPDEGHFVAKPQNSELWYKTVLGWIEDHTAGGK